MIARLLIALGLVVVSAVAGAQTPRDPGQYFFNETFGDFREELANARAAGKKGILIMFEMDECPFCHRMKTTVLNQPDVQDYFREHFLIFPVDIEGDVEVTDFKGRSTTMKDFAFQQYRVRATPVFAFFDLDGNYIKPARFTGATRDKQEFMQLGRYVVEDAYKDQPFTRYKRAAR
ncbi:MAG: thioredoxin fold domain-containing protein [Chromatiaceae bacterium]|nr:thioredoxin family protein [Gammaproteobacteria bacterium]MCP5303973.1 thioredoxin fold domain-containing protein [Chromatiaceae bacterium]MCP5313700.1 thioredoxin fold domain-containing protein [Chromatiaceae bacterium]